VHDGYDRLGMTYEAQGDNKQAAFYYRKVIDFIREHPDQYGPEFEAVFHRLVAELDPTGLWLIPPFIWSRPVHCGPQGVSLPAIRIFIYKGYLT